MLKTRAAAALATSLLLLGTATACGGDKPSATPSLSADQVATGTFVDGLLSAMKAKSTAHVSLDLGGSLKGTGVVRYGDSTDLKLTAPFGAKQFTIVLVDGTAYLQQGAGARYSKVTKDDPVMGGLISNLAFAGPREALDALRPGIKKVERDGTSGKDTKYKVTLDANVAAKAFGGDGGVADTTAVETLEFYVADQLVHRVEGTLGGRTISMVISDWGKPVDIVAPTGDQLLNG